MEVFLGESGSIKQNKRTPCLSCLILDREVIDDVLIKLLVCLKFSAGVFFHVHSTALSELVWNLM